LCLSGCIGGLEAAKLSHLERARAGAEGSSDGERVGQWLAAELVAPNGSKKRAEAARKRLAALRGRGAWASLARAIDADAHGRFGEAEDAYAALLAASRERARADAGLLGWFAAHRLVSLSAAVPSAYDKAEPLVEEIMKEPGAAGFRARGEIVEWWSRELLRDNAVPKGDELFARIAKAHGCLQEAALAGPFGHGVVADHRVHFEAEDPAPWPAQFAPDPRRGQTPVAMAAVANGCLLRAEEATMAGVYYVQSFVDLEATRDVIIAVQGAYAIFVDDQLVLDRDMAQWGNWPRFGVRLRLAAGRHRILARLVKPESAIRVLGKEGQPLGLRGSAVDGAPYALKAPTRLPDPNVLEPFLRALGVAPLPRARPPENRGIDIDHPVLRYVAAYLAHVEGQDDVASVLLEPLVKKHKTATAMVLAQQAVFVDNDPIYAPGVAHDLSRDLRQAAADKDDALWGPRLWLALQLSDKGKPTELVAEVEGLAKRFPDVPAVLLQLASIYGRLGWPVEHQRALELAAERFPDDVEVLESLMEARERRGDRAGADEIAKRIAKVDPTAEVALKRALARGDWAGAIAELRRIGKLRADRRDITFRVAELLERSGAKAESLEKLELALAASPGDAGARLALADSRYAAGDKAALTSALVDAIYSGADDARLRYALELAEGVTDLEPYRREGLAVIHEFEAAGVALPGRAVRVLDYAALWIAPDGSARMLEHEIIRIQDREAIPHFVEQQLPQGAVLRMRTIKADGRILEPEVVAGKPTITMPHLEVGDYIETEYIWSLSGPTARTGGGNSFRSPRWFFREENTSYHVSEFVVITPEGSPELVVETTGEVPNATVTKAPGHTVRTWRVEGSVALPEEPQSAPIQEFLPSVRVGWGIDLEWQLARLADLAQDDAAPDPRMVRIARRIVRGKDSAAAVKKMSVDDRARRIYRWVLDNIQPGEERTGPRIITSQSGDLTQAFIYLCRIVGIDARLGLVRDVLSPAPTGPFSEAEFFNVPAVRIKTEQGTRWLMVQERAAPYGYLPSALRGQPAVVLQHAKPPVEEQPPPLERETTPVGGVDTGVSHVGTIDLAADGSAIIKVTQEYHDRWAFQLRKWLSEVSDARRAEEVEARLLGLALPGARVKDLDVENLDDIDAPMRLELAIEAPGLARLGESELILELPFLGSLGRLVRLPTRQTPLYIGERLATRTRIEFTVRLPPGAEVISAGDDVAIEDGRITVITRTKKVKGGIHVVRELILPAGRIQPADYADFRARVLEADEALTAPIRIRMPSA
jgi:hypothetical protein